MAGNTATSRYRFFTSLVFVEDAARGFGASGFGIDAQHMLGARGAHHHPADIAKINFDPVEIFAANDGPIEDAREFGAGEMFDGAVPSARAAVPDPRARK